jgi:glycerol-3-phosphate dehydrogenase
MITSTKEFDLAVVGAGIVGLACAPVGPPWATSAWV